MHAWQFEGCHSIGRDIFLLCTLAPVTRVIPIPYGVEAIWRGVSVRKEIECLTMILRIWEKRRTDLYRSLTLLRKEARVNPNASEIIKLKVQEFCFPHFKKSTPQFLWVGRGLNLLKTNIYSYMYNAFQSVLVRHEFFIFMVIQVVETSLSWSHTTHNRASKF